MQTEVLQNTSAATNHEFDGWSPSLTGCFGLILFQITFKFCFCPKWDVEAFINCPNARDKAPPEFVWNLIGLSFREIHQIPLPLSTHFISSLHPPQWLIHLDTYFHNSGWSSHFFHAPHPVTANNQSVRFHFIFLIEAASSSSMSQRVGSSNRTWQKKRKYVVCNPKIHTHIVENKKESGWRWVFIQGSPYLHSVGDCGFKESSL